MIKPSELLSRFADATDTLARRAALIDLIKAKQLHKAVGTESLCCGLGRLAASARDAEDMERLLAVATLQRAAASSPPIRKAVRSLLTDSLTRPLSSLHKLPDVDDRLYAAKSWRVAPSAWSPEVLAAAAAHEESGEAARRECVEGLVELSGDLSGAISSLRQALLAVEFHTKKPGDSLGRRLTRVIGALTAVLSGTEKPVGENAGRELSAILDRGFRSVGRPESAAVRTAVVEQVAVLTHTIVRTDFSNADRDKTYAAMSVVSEWFAAHEWHEMCTASKAISRVRQDVQKALLSLVRRGGTDNDLRRALGTVSGSRQKAEALCREMAVEHPGIPDDVRDWLAGVSVRESNDSAVEDQERKIDKLLAELHLVMTGLASAANRVRSEVLPEVAIVLPQQERALLRLAGTVDVMANKLSLAVKWRSLRLRGTVGEEVEYSSVEHELDEGVRSRHVRLLTPVVERISEDGVPRVVLKATVEPVREPRPAAVGASA